MELRSKDNSWSFLEIGGHLLLELGQCGGPTELLAVDEERRRGLDVELRRATLPHLFDAVENLLILEAFVEACLGEAGLLADGQQWRKRPLHCPGALLLEQCLDHREIAVLAAAAGQH